MLVYKINVLESLKEAGYNSTRILKEGIINQSAMQSFRRSEMVGIKVIGQLCKLLDMQPGNIIKYVEDEEDEK
ncbi:MAG: XRE family transcriptional regulator [Lachnospiraceae bacterium]|nr:XRE family transcriptional regulator [Lachnospiraceae bacterium]